ncbi:hypothetical protein SAMN03159313_0191 [Pseudomonas sp. NFIX46]|jgi:hypothetical protein|nr:hypothetical protein SAMN03159313_0191 [Pseudomonas sp. NFIX46]
MDSGAKRSQRDYTLTFKLSVVDQVEKGELSYKEAQRRYGIQGGRRCWFGYASMVGKTGAKAPPFVPKGTDRWTSPLCP